MESPSTEAAPSPPAEPATEPAAAAAHTEEEPSPSEPAAPSLLRRILGRPILWLGIFVSVFAAVCTTISYISYLNIDVGGLGAAWDLATFQQALSTTWLHFHGPFYEAMDCGWTSRCSFLLVHPALGLYVLVPIYHLFPSAVTLIVIQSVAVALAAVPLFLLACDVTHSRNLGLLIAGLFLLWLPVLASADHSFHLENFLPIELFTLFYLWNRGHYGWGLLVAAISFVTLEIAPFLVFFFGLFFLVPSLWAGGVALWTAARNRLRPGNATPSSEPGLWQRAAATLRERTVLAAIGLMAVSVAGYVLLRLLVLDFGTALLGLPPLPAVYHLPLSTPNPFFAHGLGGLSFQTQDKIEYLIFIFASLGFIQFVSPRTIILALPYLAFILLGESTGYYEFGTHYAAIAAGPLMIGFCYGVERLPLLWRRLTAPSPNAAGGAGESSAPKVSPAVTVRSSKRVGWRIVGTTLLVGVIGFNLLISPLSPTFSDVRGVIGDPFFLKGAELPVDLTILPGFENVESLVSTIPANGVVAAPTNLMPLVANDPYAFPMQRYNASALPFNSSLPRYLLVDSFTTRAELGRLVLGTNETFPKLGYNLTGVVETSPVGMVFLYERAPSKGYVLYGPAATFPYTLYTTTSMEAGNGAGPAIVDPTAPYNPVLVTRTNATAGDALWTGPAVDIPVGDYRVTMELKATPTGTVKSTTAILHINVNPRGYGVIQTIVIRYSQLDPGAWASVTVPLNLTEPIFDLDLDGIYSAPAVQLSFSSLAIYPASD